MRLTCRGAGSAKPGLRGYSADLPRLHRLFPQCPCRVGDSAQGTSVKGSSSRRPLQSKAFRNPLPQSLQKPRADDIRPTRFNICQPPYFTGEQSSSIRYTACNCSANFGFYSFSIKQIRTDCNDMCGRLSINNL